MIETRPICNRLEHNSTGCGKVAVTSRKRPSTINARNEASLEKTTLTLSRPDGTKPEFSRRLGKSWQIGNRSPYFYRASLLLHGKSHCEGLNLGARTRSGNLYRRSSRRRDT